MAPQKPKQREGEVALRERTPKLEEMRAQRRARRETNRRVEELKMTLLRITEHHMDHAVRLIRRWLTLA